ncbi:MAG: hypothetical protein CL797_04680 [Chromatiales bacterium]|nr:hypothetical protein [Chromatiales bacterium]
MLDRRKFESTTEIPNRMSGPEILGLSVPLPELAREHGFAEGTIYTWKAKYGGMEVTEAKRLRELETENKKLKKLLAETMLEKVALKDALGRKW